jgi:type IV secretion system protein TrbL
MDPFEYILASYDNSAYNWSVLASHLAERLFMLLVVINLSWTAAIWMLQKDDPVGLLINFFLKVVALAFFLMIIRHFEDWIPAIYQSLRQAGEYMTGVSELRPSDIVKQGVHLASTIMDVSHKGGLLEQIGGALFNILVALLVFLSFLGVAIQMTLIVVGGKIILSGGMIMLGFSGSKWTLDYAQRYFAAAIHIGLKLLFLTLIVGLGQDLSPTWASTIQNTPPENLLQAFLAVLASSLLFFFLAWRIPEIGASLLSGSLSMNLGADIVSATASAGYIAKRGIQAVGSTGAGLLSAGPAILQAAKAGNAAARASGATGLKKVGVAIGTSIKTLSSATGAYIRQEYSKTTGGKIANQIRILSAANSSKKEGTDGQSTSTKN